MRIVLIHGHLFHLNTWRKVARRLAGDGIELLLLHQFHLDQVLRTLNEDRPGVVVADLFRDQPGFEDILSQTLLSPVRLALGTQLPPGFTTLTAGQAVLARTYFEKLEPKNYYQGIRYLAGLAGLDLAAEPPCPVRTHGIHHPRSDGWFTDVESYFHWLTGEADLPADGPVAALLCYHGQLVEDNHAEVDQLIRSLENQGLAPLCVFSQGMADSSLPRGERYPWLGYLQQAGPRLACLINAMAGRFLSNADDLPLLAGLDIPVFQGIRLHRRSRAEWLADPQGVPATGLVYSLAQPETSGVIEPTLLAAEEMGPDGTYAYAPVAERCSHLARRAAAWAELRRLPTAEKKLALVLHNNPCRGVEATAGQAVGLDAAQSAVELMNRLAGAGYRVSGIPADGRALMALIDRKKAISEFRWTTVDQIVDRGGALHLVGKEEYESWFRTLPEEARQKVIDDWGPFPGQGMVLDEDGPEPKLVISGLEFGDLTLIVQPKRGCYGPKCTGEVCRILHDPAISPPHHWLAVYRHLQEQCHAIIHLGTEGALEYLPGKRAGLSEACFPEISLGDLPNIYVYVMDVPGEGLMAKRRGRAVIVDHLTPPRRPSPDSEAAQELKERLAQYRRAGEMGDAARLAEIRELMIPALVELKFLPPGADEDLFREALETAARQLDRRQAAMMTDGLHVLGRAPRGDRRAALLANMLERPPRDLPSLEKLLVEKGGSGRQAFDDLCRELAEAAEGSAGRSVDDPLAGWLAKQAAALDRSGLETDQVLAALEGRFIMPGLGGSLALGRHDALPTGRNFFAQDVTRLPSRAACRVGRDLADQLITRYLAEEGRFPASVGLSLWSSDAFKCDGEVCAQILHLLGVRPVRDSRGKVGGVQALPLDELEVATPDGPQRRPRVDVVIQTSGVLRDMVPNFVKLMDQAARLVADLDEPEEWNAPRRHNRQRLDELRASMADENQPALRRMVASRVFSSEPGSYGLGVGLAIDASAWENQDDLAEIYVNWGGWAYGDGDFRRQAREAFAAHLTGVEISYMKQASPEYDLLDCGGYADFQGGMAAAAAALGGKGPKLYWGDSGRGGQARVRILKDELERSVRTRLLSQAWLDALKEHGPRGAMEVVNKVLTVYRWSATSGQVDQWAFEALTEHLVMNRENLDWLRQANPYALEEMTRRLLEADSRGLWQAEGRHLEALHEAALDLEGDLEEAMGQVKGEFQGSQVEVLTEKDVELWRPQWRIKPRT